MTDYELETGPLEIIGLMPLSGGLLSCVSSLLSVLICKQI